MSLDDKVIFPNVADDETRLFELILVDDKLDDIIVDAVMFDVDISLILILLAVKLVTLMFVETILPELLFVHETFVVFILPAEIWVNTIFVVVIFVDDMFVATIELDVISVTLIDEDVIPVEDNDDVNIELAVIFVNEAVPDEIDVVLTVPALTTWILADDDKTILPDEIFIEIKLFVVIFDVEMFVDTIDPDVIDVVRRVPIVPDELFIFELTIDPDDMFVEITLDNVLFVNNEFVPTIEPNVALVPDIPDIEIFPMVTFVMDAFVAISDAVVAFVKTTLDDVMLVDETCEATTVPDEMFVETILDDVMLVDETFEATIDPDEMFVESKLDDVIWVNEIFEPTIDPVVIFVESRLVDVTFVTCILFELMFAP